MKNLIDLHIHTKCSDGELTPIEVIDIARQNGVKTISITDHDTIEAYTDDLYKYAENNGVKLKNGVEISSKINGISVHVLGYDFDINNFNLKKTLEKLKNSRHEYLNKVVNKLTKLGYILNVEKLCKIEIVTKAHIAEDIIKNDLNKKILIKNFKHVPNKGEFIETIMNKGCAAYVEKYTVTPKQASDLIKNAGGKVILAHPVAYKYETSLSDDDVLNLIKEINADGIESNYIYVDKFNNIIDERDKWNKIAIENDLIVTIGSDFHCKDSIHPNIGLL